jgi:large subunit ribosomal protein L24
MKKMSSKIRKGDKVMAIAGNFRGQIGTVLSCDGEKVIVQGLNLRKRHVKKNQQNPQGGIIELEKPIHISNLKVCVDGKPVKLRIRKDKEGGRELFYEEGTHKKLYRSVRTNKS